MWGTECVQCLPSTVYPPPTPLSTLPLFFFLSGTGACSSVYRKQFFEISPC